MRLLICAAILLQPLQQPADAQTKADTNGKPPSASTTSAPPSRTADDRIADYNFWLTIFTAALVGASIWQGYFIVRADRTATKAANAAKLAAESAIASDRAYVYVGKVATQDLNKKQGDIVAGTTRPVVFGNFGKTPAQLLTWVAYVQYWNGGKPRELTKEQPIHGIWLAAGYMAAPFDVRVDARPQEIEAARNGVGEIALIGRVKYLDVFKVCHETGFCMLWNFKSHELTPAPGEQLNYNEKVDC